MSVLHAHVRRLQLDFTDHNIDAKMYFQVYVSMYQKIDDLCRPITPCTDRPDVQVRVILLLLLPSPERQEIRHPSRRLPMYAHVRPRLQKLAGHAQVCAAARADNDKDVLSMYWHSTEQLVYCKRCTDHVLPVGCLD